jgi:hypothetical protein
MASSIEVTDVMESEELLQLRLGLESSLKFLGWQTIGHLLGADSVGKRSGNTGCRTGVCCSSN